MKPEYLNKISKIFIKSNHRNKVRFARNLYYVNSLSRELNFPTYSRMSDIVHTFINIADPNKASDMFLLGDARSIFSSMYLLRVNLAQVKFAKTVKAQLEREDKTKTKDYTGIVFLLDNRKAACFNIYTSNILPTLKLIIEYLELHDENFNKSTDRSSIKLRNAGR